MTEDDRKALYWSLLRGLADQAQDQLCAADQQHAWSEWHNSVLQHDIPLRPVSLDNMAVAANETYRIKSERHCLNCGKEQMR